MPLNGITPILEETILDSAAADPTTVVKYEKSSCLFCNDWFDAQTFTEHLIHCGQVLEQCPNTCNVFVPRIRMRSHLKECPRGKQHQQHQQQQQQQQQRLSSSLQHLDHNIDQRVHVLEQDTSTLRSVLNEEIRQRLHLITDVGNLRKQNQVAEDRTRATEDILTGLKAGLETENVQRIDDFRYCFDVTQTIKNEIQHEIDALQKHVNQLSLEVATHQNQLNDNIMQLQEMVLDHQKANRDKFIVVEDFLNDINTDLKTKFTANSVLSGKQETLDCEVKGMKNIVCETEERCDKLEAIVSGIDQKLHHTMQNLADLENQLATQQRIASIQNVRGQLVWRIKDYSKKLQEAKQYDTILHSAMFSNRAFGYALRLDIYLNGKGSWKGRNMIACLNVLAGEYDPLLTWPCRLQADVIIRDQNGNSAGAQDYIKTVQVRKKSDDFLQTNQYFHIPHKVIESRNYLKNDCLFVEVRVLK